MTVKKPGPLKSFNTLCNKQTYLKFFEGFGSRTKQDRSPDARNVVKGIDQPFGSWVEKILIQSLLVSWRLGYFFLSHFKGPSSQDQQKTIRRRLITCEVSLTGQSHFMLISVLRKVTLPIRINSVPLIYAIGPKNPVKLNESN
jgi:hypothetical protein